MNFSKLMNVQKIWILAIRLKSLCDCVCVCVCVWCNFRFYSYKRLIDILKALAQILKWIVLIVVQFENIFFMFSFNLRNDEITIILIYILQQLNCKKKTRTTKSDRKKTLLYNIKCLSSYNTIIKWIRKP